MLETQLELWRRLGQCFALDWRLARSDKVLPSAMVADSRSRGAASTTWVRGTNGGKQIKGVKLFAVCDKHGSLLDHELRPANTDDRAGVLPMLPRLTAHSFKGVFFAVAALEYDIRVFSSHSGTHDGRFHLRECMRTRVQRTNAVAAVPAPTLGEQDSKLRRIVRCRKIAAWVERHHGAMR